MAATPQTAVAVIEPQALTTYALDEFPEERFNRIIPTQTIRMPSDLLVPVVQVVQLDPTDHDGKSADHYKSSDVPAGHRALTARGLNKVATAAAVSFYDERRTDDGSNPDLIGVSVMASMLLPTGQRITAPGSKQVDLSAQSWATAAQRAKYKSFFYEHVSTRARNRAIRALLSLRASYRDADIAKPFAVVSYAPNMNHPAIRERYLDSIAPATNALYGPQAAAQLPAGEPVAALKEIPADDDDDQAGDQAAKAPGDDDLPPFLRAAEPAADVSPSLLTRIRDTAEAGGMHGGAKDPQIKSLQEIFAPLGGRATTAGLQALWPELDVNALTANQAQAIIGTARSHETPEAFQADWRAMAGLE